MRFVVFTKAARRHEQAPGDLDRPAESPPPFAIVRFMASRARTLQRVRCRVTSPHGGRWRVASASRTDQGRCVRWPDWGLALIPKERRTVTSRALSPRCGSRPTRGCVSPCIACTSTILNLTTRSMPSRLSCSPRAARSVPAPRGTSRNPPTQRSARGHCPSPTLRAGH
jgi:hypothetical protein